MYAIIFWMMDETYITFIQNRDGSIMLFDTLRDADKYAEGIKPNDSVRVISIEGVKE